MSLINTNQTARRTDDQILSDISGCYARLNLSVRTSGQSLSQVRQLRESSVRGLRTLFRELGRTVSQVKCEQWRAGRA